MDTDMQRRIIIADDQTNVRSALRLVLEQDPGARVIAEAADAVGLLKAVERGGADMILLDWELPGLPMHHLLRLLRDLQPVPLLVAMSSRPEARQEALQSGLSHFLSKGALPEEVLAIVATWPG